jgi:hypothetical protein
MGSNDLSGTLPASWAAMTKLETLWVAAGWPAGHLEGCRRQHWIIMQLGRKHQLSTEGPCLLPPLAPARAATSVSMASLARCRPSGAPWSTSRVCGPRATSCLATCRRRGARWPTWRRCGQLVPARLPCPRAGLLRGLVRLVHVQLMMERLLGEYSSWWSSCQCPLLCRNLYNNSFESAVPASWSAWKNLETL